MNTPNQFTKEEEYQYDSVKISVALIFIIIIFITIYVVALRPFVQVWHESMHGQGELARAESNRQIAICEANAKKESSKALADAEIIRAEGVAKANKIIGDSLEDNEGYLRYLWVQALQSNNTQVIYVPTEANLPILESQRLKRNNPNE